MALLDNIGDAYGAFAGPIGDGLSSIGDIFSPYGSMPQGIGNYNLRYPSDLGSSGSVMDSQEGSTFIFNSSPAFGSTNTGGNPYISFELFQPILDTSWSTIESKYTDAELADRNSKLNKKNTDSITFGKGDASQTATLKAPEGPPKPPVLTYDSKYKISLYMTPAINISDQMHYETGSRAAMAWAQRFGSSGSSMDDAATDIAMGMSHFGQEAMTAIAGASYLSKKLSTMASGAVAALGAPAAALGNEHIRRSGQVFNPNEYLQFKNSQLRTFSFQFKFLPNSHSESNSASAIIKAFRAAMRPKKLTALVMEAPYRVQTTFMNAGSMPQISTSYITGVSVTYNPNSASFFKRSGEAVEIDLSIQLSEIAPLYRGDVEGNITDQDGTYGDSFSGHPNQMGGF